MSSGSFFCTFFFLDCFFAASFNQLTLQLSAFDGRCSKTTKNHRPRFFRSAHLQFIWLAFFRCCEHFVLHSDGIRYFCVNDCNALSRWAKHFYLFSLNMRDRHQSSQRAHSIEWFHSQFSWKKILLEATEAPESIELKIIIGINKNAGSHFIHRIFPKSFAFFLRTKWNEKRIWIEVHQPNPLYRLEKWAVGARHRTITNKQKTKKDEQTIDIGWEEWKDGEKNKLYSVDCRCHCPRRCWRIFLFSLTNTLFRFWSCRWQFEFIPFACNVLHGIQCVASGTVLAFVSSFDCTPILANNEMGRQAITVEKHQQQRRRGGTFRDKKSVVHRSKP